MTLLSLTACSANETLPRQRCPSQHTLSTTAPPLAAVRRSSTAPRISPLLLLLLLLRTDA